MQTFLPIGPKDSGKVHFFVASARALDSKRLGKQRLECMQILKALETGQGWIHHPIVKMWKNNPAALKAYFNAIVKEWEHRGFVNNYAKFPISRFNLPIWLGQDSLIYSAHRASLIAKDPGFYGTTTYNWSEVGNHHSNLWYDMDKLTWYWQNKYTKERTYIQRKFL